jgi:anti-sigma regulatory factor (Ser/Thr protein kinase)
MTSAERSLRLPGVLASVREGRMFARDVVREWGLDGLVDDVQLGTSELITNAVRHAGTDLAVSLRLDTRLVVEVRDSDPDLRHPGAALDHDLLATSGRGLHIVAAISSDWGVTSIPGGKAVWFALPLPEVGSHDADVFTLDERRAEHRRAEQQRTNGSSEEMQARVS